MSHPCCVVVFTKRLWIEAKVRRAFEPNAASVLATANPAHVFETLAASPIDVLVMDGALLRDEVEGLARRFERALQPGVTCVVLDTITALAAVAQGLDATSLALPETIPPRALVAAVQTRAAALPDRPVASDQHVPLELDHPATKRGWGRPPVPSQGDLYGLVVSEREPPRTLVGLGLRGSFDAQNRTQQVNAVTAFSSVLPLSTPERPSRVRVIEARRPPPRAASTSPRSARRLRSKEPRRQRSGPSVGAGLSAVRRGPSPALRAPACPSALSVADCAVSSTPKTAPCPRSELPHLPMEAWLSPRRCWAIGGVAAAAVAMTAALLSPTESNLASSCAASLGCGAGEPARPVGQGRAKESDRVDGRENEAKRGGLSRNARGARESELAHAPRPRAHPPRSTLEAWGMPREEAAEPSDRTSQ